VRLTEDGIDLELFSPHRNFTTKLLRKVSADPTSLIKSLKPFKVASPYHFRLREAHYYDPTSHFKGQRIARKVDFMTVHPAIVSKRNVEHVIIEPLRSRLGQGHLRPEIFLVRHFPLSEIVGKEGVVGLVARAVEPMMPYFNFALTV
jgi:hypothetical protein